MKVKHLLEFSTISGAGGGGRPKSTDITCDMAFILLVHVVVLQDKKVLDVATHMKIILPVFGFV